MFAHPLADDAELRPLEPWQAEEFAAHVDRVRDDVLPWIGWAGVVVDVETAREFLQRYADRQAADDGRIYGIWVGGRLEGGALFRFFEPKLGSCEVGVWLSRDARGRGLITRAVQHMAAWAMDVRGMNRVCWSCDPENAASIAAAKRLGMTHEGTLRKAFLMDGAPRDVQVWALVRD
ncbi:GNAT family N-acetyltransferase [Spirillospora sp. CA-294931]|uniref:GNAT family N-acetyltransferase n=1 Tax=Spirillospora sp. CA-294931 TaxID=3240042 RepID=UPI003D8B4242